MNSIDIIRSNIWKLYVTHPNIHLRVVNRKQKIYLNYEPAVIKGVYPHIFQVEENSCGSPKTYTFQYTDVLSHQIEIVELDQN